MSRILLIATCIAVISTSLADVADDETLVVKTATGTLRGKRIQVNPYQLPDYQASVAAYTRIPYAKPPVGDLRFKGPLPNDIEGDFDATRESVACSQMTSQLFDMGMELSEDCLYVDVFVPEPKPSSAAVMVWIHGGGFLMGAGSIPKALPIPLVAMNDVIVVTMNYRLGVLGFLAPGDEESPLNIGMLDQRQALVWVQENIAAFGGDPSRVTIFGESAGSMSVSMHVVSPMSTGLFSGAIMQSGTMTSGWSYKAADSGLESAFNFGLAMNCSATTSEELVTCLREKSVDELINYFIDNPMASKDFDVTPKIDGLFMPRDAKEMYPAGDVNDVAILVGCLEDEGNLFVMPLTLGTADVEKPIWNRTVMDFMVPLYIDNMDQLALDTTALIYLSPEELAKSEPNYVDVVSRFMGHWLFLCPTFGISADLSAAGNPVYTYLMSHIPSSSMWGKNLTWLGANHGEDIAYVFGSPFMLETADPDQESLMIGSFNEEEVEMSKQVMKYWSNFAKTGNPNLSSKDEDQSQDSKFPVWPTFTKESPSFKDLSMTFNNRHGHPYPKSCQYVEELLPKLQANADELNRLKSLLEEKVDADSEKSCEDPASCPEE